MTREQVTQLLARFYEAQSSEAEELALQQFFAQSPCPYPEFETDAHYFSELAQAEQRARERGDRLDALLDELAAKEESHRVKSQPARHLWQWSLGIAAALLVGFFALPQLVSTPQVDAASRYACQSEEEALYYTLKTLNTFAESIDKALARTEQLQETHEMIEQKLTKLFTPNL